MVAAYFVGLLVTASALAQETPASAARASPHAAVPDMKSLIDRHISKLGSPANTIAPPLEPTKRSTRALSSGGVAAFEAHAATSEELFSIISDLQARRRLGFLYSSDKVNTLSAPATRRLSQSANSQAGLESTRIIWVIGSLLLLLLLQ